MEKSSSWSQLMGKISACCSKNGEAKRRKERSLKTATLKSRLLRHEELEDRRLLAVTAAEYDSIRSEYENFLVPDNHSTAICDFSAVVGRKNEAAAVNDGGLSFRDGFTSTDSFLNNSSRSYP